MACVVEYYNPATAPSAGVTAADILIPESLQAELVVAGSDTLLVPSPGAFAQQDLCSSEHSLHSSSESGVETQDDAATTRSPPLRAVTTATAGLATRDEPSSPSPIVARQLGRPTAELAERIHDTMRQREAALPPLQLTSPQLHKRTFVVDFLCGACEMLHLTRNTKFLAMLLVDHFMDKHIVMDYRLKLVALASLLVSAKFEEHEDNVVTMHQMQLIAQQCGENPDNYNKQEFLKMELYLLKFFSWTVSYPTAIGFAEYFLSLEDIDVEEDDSTISFIQQQSDEAKVQMDRLTSCFLEASLREPLFLQYPCSLIAAASLCASRICLGFPTAWNHKLATVTHYDLQTLSTPVDHMLKLFYNDYDV